MNRGLAILLLIVGLLAVATGVIYLGVPANKLPSFIPGHIAAHPLKSGHVAGTGHHTKRGIAALVVGVLLLVGGGALFARSRRRY